MMYRRKVVRVVATAPPDETIRRRSSFTGGFNLARVLGH